MRSETDQEENLSENKLEYTLEYVFQQRLKTKDKEMLKLNSSYISEVEIVREKLIIRNIHKYEIKYVVNRNLTVEVVVHTSKVIVVIAQLTSSVGKAQNSMVAREYV